MLKDDKSLVNKIKDDQKKKKPEDLSASSTSNLRNTIISRRDRITISDIKLEDYSKKIAESERK